MGNLQLVGEINPNVGLLKRSLLHWGKTSRIPEIDSDGEKFSEIEILAGNCLDPT